MPSGMIIKKAIDASRAWSLTLFSYSDRGGDRDDIAIRIAGSEREKGKGSGKRGASAEEYIALSHMHHVLCRCRIAPAHIHSVIPIHQTPHENTPRFQQKQCILRQHSPQKLFGLRRQN